MALLALRGNTKWHPPMPPARSFIFAEGVRGTCYNCVKQKSAVPYSIFWNHVEQMGSTMLRRFNYVVTISQLITDNTREF